jgi:hypothetical protein
MAQTTLDDDDLFSEAASEMREDVESSLEKARAALPDPRRSGTSSPTTRWGR